MVTFTCDLFEVMEERVAKWTPLSVKAVTKSPLFKGNECTNQVWYVCCEICRGFDFLLDC